VGVVGTGFIGAGLANLLHGGQRFHTCGVLTRREGQIQGLPSELLTRELEQLVEQSDIIVECSGDVSHAAKVVETAFQAGKPVVTLAAEFHVTLGSYFEGKGYLTEAEGDQPGSTAALLEEAVSMGFTPRVLGNMKGYLNHRPTAEDMAYWSGRNGISLPQVTSFTNGTKLQIEQALLANGKGATIAQRGLLGLANDDLNAGAKELATAAGEGCIADYLISSKLPAGVFVTGTAASNQAAALRYLKMGEGPYYTLMRPYHLCHLEVIKTLQRVANGGTPLLTNSAKPTINIAAMATRDLAAGYTFGKAIGSLELRGEAIKFSDAPDAVPLGLLDGARLKHSIADGQTLTWSDVDLADSLASRIGLEMRV
jgi:predicted homoserine dehydrogenase-like protein